LSPTIYREGPYRFSFFANEGNEPAHVHVARERMQAKFWLTPTVTLAHAVGFSAIELRRLQQITQENRQKLVEAWNEFFSQ
jgi:Domain of unknown function (DUF4160)